MMKNLLLFIAVFCLTAFCLVAQVNPQAPLEFDKNVKVGKLENGLTYYIMHNEKPAQRADFYIVTKVGAVQEDPDQDGLAHFLEHMCLNGSEHFPGKGIISYMESIGCAFGANINAGTGFEQTSYMLNNVPVTREGIIDSSLLILFDYSAHVTNAPEEIEAERGVILEEKRTRDNFQWRLSCAFRNALFRGSKMETCSLIGSEENLKTFKPQSLVNFYKTWYRPDLQAIIVVGDVDVDKVEGKIKTLFSQTPKAENPRAKQNLTVPDNKEPIVKIHTDKELNSTIVLFYAKSQPLPREYRNLGVGLLTNTLQDVISMIINERLDDISKKSDAPFFDASAGFGSLLSTLDGFGGEVDCKDGEALKAFKAYLVELERVKKYGFSDDEYDRAKKRYLKSLEVAKENAPSRQNGQLVNGLINNFVSGWPFITPEYKYETVKSFLDMIPLAALNQIAGQLYSDDNLVIFCATPDKEGVSVPTEQELLNVLADVKKEDIKAPESSAINEPLLDASSIKGSKVKKTEQGKFGSTIWKLANGIEVIVKPTDYMKDQVLFSIVAKGGKSILPTELLPSVNNNILSIYSSNAGLGKFTESQIDKMLSGKSVNVNPYMSNLEHGISGGASPKDFETMLQLAYMYIYQPRFVEEEFAVGFNQIKAYLPNLMKQPNFKFSYELQKAVSCNSERRPVLDEQLLSNVSLANLEKAYRMLCADMSNAKVYIVGNVNLDEIKPLVEKYIGALPVKSKKGTMWVDEKVDFPKGVVDNTFEFEMQTPKTSIAMIYSADIKKSLENDIRMTLLSNVMDQLYTKTIREDEGGTYGVSTMATINGEPRDRAVVLINFDTDFAKSEKLIALAKKGFEDMAVNGVNEEYLNKSKENLIKSFPESQIRNNYWNGLLKEYYGFNRDNYTNYIETVKAVTPESIQALVKDIISQGNRLDVIMNPKK